MNRGDLIILASQVAWITYSLYSRAAASTLPPVWVMAGANLAAGLVLVPLALLVERPWQHWWAWRGWLVVLYGALPVTVGHLWFYQIVRTIGAGRAVTFLNLMPFAVLTMAWLLVGETIHVYHVIGAGAGRRRRLPGHASGLNAAATSSWTAAAGAAARRPPWACRP